MNDRRIRVETRSIFISLIIPVFNEAALLAEFITESVKVLQSLSEYFELILIDDGSTDESVSIIKSLMVQYPAKLIKLSRNFGKEIALTAGLDFCRGEVAILIDADFQHPFETLASFVARWQEGYDMVYGVRLNRDEKGGWLKSKLAILFYRFTEKMSEVPIPRDAGDFRLLDRKVIDALKQFPERNRMMKGLYAWVGFKSMGIPFEVSKRKAGKSSWNLWQLTKLALNGIFGFSTLPIRVWSIIGLCIAVLSFFYVLFIVCKALIFGVDVPGFATLAVAIIFFGGIQLLSIGILGEYIARIFTEVKKRPAYLIDEKIGF